MGAGTVSFIPRQGVDSFDTPKNLNFQTDSAER